MTIKTLEYIHELLKKEEEKTRETYNAARKLQYDFEESDSDKDLIKGQEHAADLFMEDHFSALHALEDFESQEW